MSDDQKHYTVMSRTICPVCEPIIEDDCIYSLPCGEQHDEIVRTHFLRSLRTDRINVPNVERPWSPYPEPT